jgi:hypothetical protein
MWPIWSAGSCPLRSESDRPVALPRNDASCQKLPYALQQTAAALAWEMDELALTSWGVFARGNLRPFGEVAGVQPPTSPFEDVVEREAFAAERGGSAVPSLMPIASQSITHVHSTYNGAEDSPCTHDRSHPTNPDQGFSDQGFKC